MNQDIRRQNFNVDAGQAAVLELARQNLHASSIKDAMLRSARLVNTIARELTQGKKLMVMEKNGQTTRLLIPEFESADAEWLYLCERPHPWRRQLYVKGRKLLASTVWNDMIANNLSPEQAAADRELPLAAILETVRYCEQHEDLIRLEADEEKSRLLVAGDTWSV